MKVIKHIREFQIGKIYRNLEGIKFKYQDSYRGNTVFRRIDNIHYYLENPDGTVSFAGAPMNWKYYEEDQPFKFGR